MRSPLLKIENVTVKFGGLIAVENINLKLYQDSLLGFIGPNGAGKTTLVRVISGIIQPTFGNVFLDKINITKYPTFKRVHAGISLAQQIVKPMHQMTLLDNITLAFGKEKLLSPLKAIKTSKKEKEKEKAYFILKKVGLEKVSKKLPTEVPLGYLKRLELARSLATNPKILLLDEPLAGLSKNEAHEMADLINSLRKPGLAILLIEHNLEQVMRICENIYVQSNGKSLAIGKTKDVMKNLKVKEAYLGKV
tara:strand:+ start:34 stop:783 length:750 start_codon:yes stop_codon:yes gene_type:complete